MAVTIYLTANVSDVVQFLQDNGGDPRNVGEDYIEAYVPVSLLGAVSERPGVIRVREITPPQKRFGNVVSQGVTAHLASPWHTAGFNGQGVKVGVIDSGDEDAGGGGFDGLRRLMGVELPSTVERLCFTDMNDYSNNLAACDLGGTDDHGTIVAEALMDIAPGASLYISNPISATDLQTAVDWMAGQGVQVIAYSIGWRPHGPGDGTSPLHEWSSQYHRPGRGFRNYLGQRRRQRRAQRLVRPLSRR